MTFEKREITIPSWAVTAVVSILITVMGYAIGIAKVHASTDTDIAHVKEEISELEENKASRESVKSLESILLRVEGKLDRHIEQQINN